MQHRRILFFAEAVTLAHVARPIVLAICLEGLGHEPVMACDDRYRRFMADQTWQTLPLRSISSQRFLRSLAWGTPAYDLPTLRRYVAEDIDLIQCVKPDLIVGDFPSPSAPGLSAVLTPHHERVLESWGAATVRLRLKAGWPGS